MRDVPYVRSSFNAEVLVTYIQQALSAETTSAAENKLAMAERYVLGAAHDVLGTAAILHKHIVEIKLRRYSRYDRYARRKGIPSHKTGEEFKRQADLCLGNINVLNSGLPMPRDAHFIPMLEDGLLHLEQMRLLNDDIQTRINSLRDRQGGQVMQNLTSWNLFVAVLTFVATLLAIIVSVIIADPDRYSALRKFLFHDKPNRPILSNPSDRKSTTTVKRN